jgi:hypothetical protein
VLFPGLHGDPATTVVQLNRDACVKPSQDVEAMVRGVAESSVYVLYLTRDALSKYVLLEAWMAMKLQKPVIVLQDHDVRDMSYAGSSLEEALAGWPHDLHEYFRTGRFVTWMGQPMEWSIRDQNAKLGTIFDRCIHWEKTGLAQIPNDGVSWQDALDALGRRVMP